MSTKGITVLGAGSWGTAVAHLIGSNHHPVTLWCRRDEAAREITEQHTNTRYLGDLRLSEQITASTDLAACLRDAGLIFVVIPSKSFRAVSRAVGDVLTPDQYVIHATKGIEPKSYHRMSEILLQETCAKQIGVLSGPNIAAEICAGKPAGTVIASRYPNVIKAADRALASRVLRVYGNDDVLGVELAGALKNIVAIAAGMATEMNLGENAKALLITRGLSEISRLGVALGAKAVTFMGLAGIGDLMVTCASTLSRNHQVGRALARGESLQQALDSLGMVAEGVNTALVAHEIISRDRIDAPLLQAIYRVLYDGLAPAEALGELMRLSSRHDIDLALGI